MYTKRTLYCVLKNLVNKISYLTTSSGASSARLEIYGSYSKLGYGMEVFFFFTAGERRKKSEGLRAAIS